MSDELKYHHVQYGMGFKVSKEALEADAAYLPPRVSLKPGKRWFARLACRIHGHLPKDGDGRCPRCRMTLVGVFENLQKSIARSAQYVQEQLARDLYRDREGL